MKSLVESLFDGDLVSKDTGLEYLYGLIEEISIHSDFRLDYFDEKKLKHDYNQLVKKFPPKDWNSNQLLSMKKIRNIEQDEIFRELALVIVASLKSTSIKKGRAVVDDLDLETKIHDIIKPYTTDNGKWVNTWVNELPNVFTKEQSRIKVHFQLGRRLGRYGPAEYAGYIIIKFNTTTLF